MTFLGGKGGYFEKLSYGPEILYGLLSNKIIRIPINNKISGLPPALWLFGWKGGGILKSCPTVLKFWMGSYITKILGFQPKKNQGRRVPTLWHFCEEKGGILKSCPRVPKLQILFLRGWGRCLKVTQQTRAQQTSAHVNGGPNGGSSMRRPGSEDANRESGNVSFLFLFF